MGTGYRVLVCTVLLLGCLVGGVIVVGGTPDTGDGVVDRPAGGQGEPSLSGYDELRYEVELRDDGSASWTVEYRYRLDDDNESVDWEALQTDVEDRSDRYLESFESDVRADVTEAENESGREMFASGFSIETDETSTAPEYGYVRIGFEWDSFAHVELNRIEAGDALGWLELDERVVFDVAWPEEYSETTAEPTPDDRRETAVIWHGEETEFRDGEPRIEVMDTGGEPVDAGEQPDRFYTLPWLVVAGAVALTVAGVGWWVTRGEEDPLESTEPTHPEGGTEPDRPPPELLSNEERVLCLIEDRGGRIKQQEVVSELEWTEAKTSQVVGQLREDGEIEVFRIGRENVLALPDDDD